MGRFPVGRLGVGLWKEARDQRGIALALLIALPVLALPAAWAFGDQLPRHAFADGALFLVPVSLALYLIAIASELFAGERRRGTLDFVRRLPGGLKAAFAGKLGAYVVGSLLFAAWGWLVAAAVVALFGPPEALGELVRLSVDRFDPVVGNVCLALLALGAWILLVSAWIPQGGAAVLGALLLLALLSIPVALALMGSPWLVEQTAQSVLRAPLSPLSIAAAAPLLALTFSFLRGNRFLSSAWSPAWRGLAVVGVLAGAGYAVGASALERALTIDPLAKDFHVQGGFVGTGGRYAFVHVYQGRRAWYPSQGGGRSLDGSPIQPWIVDLATGEHRRAGDFEQGWLALGESSQAPQPILRRIDALGVNATWFDGATGLVRKTLPGGVRTPDVYAWEREGLAALAWHRDAQGRASWMEGDLLVREGDPLPKDQRHRSAGWARSIPGGWWRVVHPQGRSEYELSTIELETGRVRAVPKEAGRRLREHLSPRWMLAWRDEPVARGRKQTKPGRWWLCDLDGAEADRPVTLPPNCEAPLRVLGPGLALVLTGETGTRRRLCLWDPRTGALTEVHDEQGGTVMGEQAFVPAQRDPDVALVTVMPTPGSEEGPTSVILDAATARAQRLAVGGGTLDPLALLDARTLIAVEGSNTIVRYGPEPGAREVLFPRR